MPVTDSDPASSLAQRFPFLQGRAANRQPAVPASAFSSKNTSGEKPTMANLKDFYLKRLSSQADAAAGPKRADPADQKPAAVGQRPTLGAAAAAPASKPQRPTMNKAKSTDVEDLDVMCNTCFELIKTSEAARCTGSCDTCEFAGRSTGVRPSQPDGLFGVLNMKMHQLRAALEQRLRDTSTKVNVMRHLTQLRYHLDTALKWTVGCSEIGALSEYTVTQVKQLTAAARHLNPAVFVFSKRIENVVCQKEKELRKAALNRGVQGSGDTASGGGARGMDLTTTDSIDKANSIISDLASDCGTQRPETVVTRDDSVVGDVGDLASAEAMLSLRNEDEERRWFYSQCLTVKLSCSDKSKTRKILISDLYSQVKEEQIPVKDWEQWIRKQLIASDDEPPAPSVPSSAPVAAVPAVAAKPKAAPLVANPVGLGRGPATAQRPVPATAGRIQLPRGGYPQRPARPGFAPQ
mmetsp:Transcript_83419/g.223202  ORF Transcript_83419/g.223202 Transcript_83419/m.223202 type:complete len:464 (-) Transcript_83419:112-1503(-)